MAPLLLDIYEEHLDEAAFRWGQWERALLAPDYDLEETATPEAQLLAHLDGLVLGGPAIAEALLTPTLESGEPTAVSAALWALLEEQDGTGLKELVALLRASPLEGLVPLQRALELSGREGLGQALSAFLLQGPDAHLQVLALDVLAFRGELPRLVAMELLHHADGRVVAAALRGLRFVLAEVASRELPRFFLEARPEVRPAAIEAGMCSGQASAWAEARSALEAGEALGREPLVLMALRGEERDLRRLMERAGQPWLWADALWALGFSGRVEAAEVCLEVMRHKPMASLAGEAFCAITGLRLEESFVLPPEEEESLPPLEEDLARDLTPRPEDGLPTPDVEAVAAWWSRTRGKLSPRTRYLRGRVFSVETLLEELVQGPMRRRHVHSLELAMCSRSRFILQTRDFTWKQREALEKARAARMHLAS